MSEADVREQLAQYCDWLEQGVDAPLSPQGVEIVTELVPDEAPRNGRVRWFGPLLAAAVLLIGLGTVWSLFGANNSSEPLQIVDRQDDDPETDDDPEADDVDETAVVLAQPPRRKLLAPFGVPASSDYTVASSGLLPNNQAIRSVAVHQIKFHIPKESTSRGELLAAVIASDQGLTVTGDAAGPMIGGAQSWVSQSGDLAVVRWLSNDNEMTEVSSRNIGLAQLTEFAQQPGIGEGVVEPPEAMTTILTGIGRTYPDDAGGHVFSSSRGLIGYETTLQADASPPVMAAMFRGDPLAELVTYATLFPTSQFYIERTPEAEEAALIATDAASQTKYLVWEETANDVFSATAAPNGIVGILEADASVADDVLIDLVEQMVPLAVPGAVDISDLAPNVQPEVHNLELAGNFVVGVRSADTGADVVYLDVAHQRACVRVLGIEAQPDVCIEVDRSRPGSAIVVRSIGDDIDGGERSILVVGQSHGGTFADEFFSDPPWSITRRGIRFDLLSTFEQGPLELVVLDDEGTPYPTMTVGE